MKLLGAAFFTFTIFCSGLAATLTWLDNRDSDGAIPSKESMAKLIEVADDIRANAPATSETLQQYAAALLAYANGQTDEILVSEGTQDAYAEWMHNR